MASSTDRNGHSASLPCETCPVGRLRVLLVHDGDTRINQRIRELWRHGFEVRAVTSMPEVLDAVGGQWIADAVVLDLAAGVEESLPLVKALRDVHPSLPAVVVGEPIPGERALAEEMDRHTFCRGVDRSPVALTAAIMAISCPSPAPPSCHLRTMLSLESAATQRAGAGAASLAEC